MKDCNLVSIDLAKNIFQVCIWNQHNEVVSNKKLKRSKLLAYITKLPPSLIAMEACYSSHYWARQFKALNHHVTLIPAQHVKAFLRGNKTDANDAIAIGEAAQRPNLRPVMIKTTAQQDIQSLLRIRERHVRNRTALCNQIRGILAEYGEVISKTRQRLMIVVPLILEDAETELTDNTRLLISRLYREVEYVTQTIKDDEVLLKNLMQTQPDQPRLRSIPGVGPLTAAAVVAHIGNAKQFKTGRQMAAWIGLTPKEHSSGDVKHQMGISKRGSRHLRTLLIHCARSILFTTKDREQPLAKWGDQLIKRRGKHKAIVAVANKLARIMWVVLTRQEIFNYQPLLSNQQQQ